MHFYSLNPDGTPQWSVNQSGMYGSSAIASDGTIYQGDEFARISAYDPATGAVLWTTPLCCYGNRSVALDSNGNLYIATDGGIFGSTSLWSLAPSGALRWTTGTGNLVSAVIGPGDVIYTINSTGTLFCYHADGSQCWTGGISLGGSVVENSLSISPLGTVYPKTSLGLFAVNPDGTKAWPSPFSPGGNSSLSPSAIVDANGSIYVAFGDNVYSLDVTGRVRSGWPVAVPSVNQLVIGGTGTLYVVSAGQKLYSIGGAATLGELAAQQAKTLRYGLYGEGGKGFDYSTSDGNSCEVNSASLSCWITPTGVNQDYLYWDSNSLKRSRSGQLARLLPWVSAAHVRSGVVHE
jgi:outer membrane protein assembly factor BamB